MNARSPHYFGLLILMAQFLHGLPCKAGYIRMDLKHPGVYRVTAGELRQAGLDLNRVHPQKLALSSGGTSLPLLVKSRSGERFAEGDWLEFLGDSPRGKSTWFLPDNKSNVYFLRWDAAQPLQYNSGVAPPADPGQVQNFWQWQHLEKNYQFWFSTLPPSVTDNFYWFPVFASNTPDQILQTHLSLPGFNPTPGLSPRIELRLLGATHAQGVSPSHMFTFLYDNKPVHDFQFNGITMKDVSFNLPPQKVRPDGARISFSAPSERRNLVDKIYLDWINVRYPSRLDAQNSEVYRFNNDLTGVEPHAKHLHIQNLLPSSTIFDPVGLKVWEISAGQSSARIPNNVSLTTFTAAAPFARMKIDSMELVTSTTTTTDISPGLQTLVIYHPKVKHTAEAYTSYRRNQGMLVEAISIRTIFDENNHGYISDHALKQFLVSAKRQAPGLRHLVLIGDAHYDHREARSQTDETQHDTLIPIHWVHQPGTPWSGGYQDDNWYGSFENEFRPDIAVGRLPVNNDMEGMQYLHKVMEYESRPPAPDKALMISSVEQRFQSYVTEIGESYSDRFTTVSYQFPENTSVSREVESLRSAWDAGVDLVYYVGHGGAMVWRVGPEDFSLQKDLFTPAHIHELKNHGRYPVVICSSCYSTAFDQANSIGEALVRQPEGGAISVLGSPWKATVEDGHDFNRRLFHHYFDPRITTLGAAMLAAHREHIPDTQSAPPANSFTLLGDPCLRLHRNNTSQELTSQTATNAIAPPAPIKLRLELKDFPTGRQYRNQVLLPQGQIESISFRIPENAQILGLLGSSRSAGDVFARLRITVQSEAGAKHQLYEGYWSSVVLRWNQWPVPSAFRGQNVRLHIQMLNPATLEEQRMFYLQSAALW